MRYAIISDIHGNLEAFNEVLKALQSDRIGRYVCVGDIVGYGADPNACVKKINELTKAVVLGNHDAACIGKFDPINFNDKAKAAVLWTRQELDEKNLAFLGTLKYIYSEDNIFQAVHGSLKAPEQFYYIFGPDDAGRSFRLMSTDILFVGHTHEPIVYEMTEKGMLYFFEPVFKLKDGKRYIINVGSVGQPRDGDPRAAYVVFDSDNRTVEYKRVEYNIDKAQEKIINAGMPEYLARRLKMGL